MAATVPAHLLGLQLGGFLTAGDRGMSVRIALRHAGSAERLWREWRGLCGSSQRGSSRRDTECKFQKVPALHESVLCSIK